MRGVPFWGKEVREFAGGNEVTLVPGDDDVIGHPLADFSTVPPGDYTVQAFLNVFTTFNRADGHVVEMHLNSGAGQSPWRAPGNAMSEPQQVRIGAGGGKIELAITQVIPPTHPVPEGGSMQQGNPPDRGENSSDSSRSAATHCPPSGARTCTSVQTFCSRRTT